MQKELSISIIHTFTPLHKWLYSSTNMSSLFFISLTTYFIQCHSVKPPIIFFLFLTPSVFLAATTFSRYHGIFFISHETLKYSCFVPIYKIKCLYALTYCKALVLAFLDAHGVLSFYTETTSLQLQFVSPNFLVAMILNQDFLFNQIKQRQFSTYNDSLTHLTGWGFILMSHNNVFLFPRVSESHYIRIYWTIWLMEVIFCVIVVCSTKSL